MNPTGYPQVFDELTNGAVTRTYAYGLQRIDEEQVIDSAWTPSFYGFDGFGTVRQLTSLTGAVTDSYQFDAFGNEITHTGTTPNNYLYRGEQYDSDLGLYYLRARYYNPLAGTFLSRDPQAGKLINPISLHKYLYASGDPVNRFDPSGRDDIVVYGVRINTSYKLVPFINTISCGVAIGTSLVTGGLVEAFGDDPTGAAFTAFGCITADIDVGSRVTATFDGIGLAGCAYSMWQAYGDENVYFNNPTPKNDQKVASDLIGSVGGCVLTGIATILDLYAP